MASVRTSTSFNLLGDKALIATLEEIDAKLRHKIMRAAVSRAMRPVANEMRANIRAVARESGAWSKSIRIRGKSYRRGAITMGILGVRSDGYFLVRTKKRPQVHKRQPSKYAHLIEYGTKTIAPRMPMTRAWEALKWRAFQVVAAYIGRELRKFRKARRAA